MSNLKKQKWKVNLNCVDFNWYHPGALIGHNKNQKVKSSQFSPTFDFSFNSERSSHIKVKSNVNIPTIGYVSYKNNPNLKTCSLFFSLLNQFPHFPTLLPFLPTTRFGRVAKCMHYSLFFSFLFSSETSKKSEHVSSLYLLIPSYYPTIYYYYFFF